MFDLPCLTEVLKYQLLLFSALSALNLKLKRKISVLCHIHAELLLIYLFFFSSTPLRNTRYLYGIRNLRNISPHVKWDNKVTHTCTGDSRVTRGFGMPLDYSPRNAPIDFTQSPGSNSVWSTMNGLRQPFFNIFR